MLSSISNFANKWSQSKIRSFLIKKLNCNSEWKSVGINKKTPRCYLIIFIGGSTDRDSSNWHKLLRLAKVLKIELNPQRKKKHKGELELRNTLWFVSPDHDQSSHSLFFHLFNGSSSDSHHLFHFFSGRTLQFLFSFLKKTGYVVTIQKNLTGFGKIWRNSFFRWLILFGFSCICDSFFFSWEQPHIKMKKWHQYIQAHSVSQ